MRLVFASPNFVDHESWDKFSWIAPEEYRDEPWYYAAPKREDRSVWDLPTGKNFIQTVDPMIQPFVAWLHKKGIPTGPSCSGHRLNGKDFKKIYEGLEDDAEQIRTGGLVLRDPENDRDYLMQDYNYELPWGSFDSFRKVAGRHQPLGWLPFYTADPRMPFAVQKNPDFMIKQIGAHTFGVKTREPDPKIWRKAFSVINKALS